MKRYYDSVPFFKSLQVNYLMTYRKASFYSSKTIQGIFWRIKLKYLSEKSGIQIPTKAKIGKGFVNVDVPSHSIVIGNPAQIHYRENATEGYINRTV